MKLTRKWLIVAALVLSVAMATTGTLAYLSDTDSDVNVMTLGNVDIEQIETDAEGNPFKQNQPLYPAYYNDAAAYAEVIGRLDKVVTVKNTGTSDAYVRTFIAFEAGTLDKVGFDNLIHPEFNDASGVQWILTPIEVEGVNYFVAYYVYKDMLAPGLTTAPSLKGVYMDKKAGNADMLQFGDTYEILVLSQAVQVQNLEALGAAAALEAAYPSINDANAVAAWFGGITNMPVTTVSTVEELLAAIPNGGTVVLTAGEYEAFTLPDNTDGVTLLGSAGTVVEAINLNAARNVTLQNITFDAADAQPTYSAKTNAATSYYANITGSTGTDAGNNNGAQNISIIDCTFTGKYEGSGDYAPICFEEQGRPTSRATNITVEGCTFACDASNYIRMNYMAQGAVTIKNNVFGGTSYSTSHNTMNFTGNAADLTITGNEIYNWNVLKTAIGSSRQGTNHIDVTITGNTFINGELNPEDVNTGLGWPYWIPKSSYTADNYTLVYSNNDEHKYVEVTTSAALNDAISSGAAVIELGAGEFTADLYVVPANRELTIIGQGAATKLDFANLQVRLPLFDKLTISNCTVERMPEKSWGHLVFGSSNAAGGVYTLSNCFFNGEGSQGIYINQDVPATFNIENCTFNGDFGSEGAITIQNNDGVSITVNVTDCSFNNLPDSSHEIFVHYAYDGWTLNAPGVEAYWKANQ